ncbi:MAG: PAS domain-containing protein, partial [Asgard group archaeon]|nr:PAS domain-containing protein [Asgard group archaeon]
MENNNLPKGIGEKDSKKHYNDHLITNIIESLTHPFYIIDAKDYSIKIANSSARLGQLTNQSTCYALTHHSSKPCSDASHPCPLKIVKKTKTPAQVEHLHYDEDGNQRYVMIHGYPILDEDGEVTQMIEYALDITESKKHESLNKILISTQDLIIENMPEGVILLSQDFKIEHTNIKGREYLESILNLDENTKLNKIIESPFLDFIKTIKRNKWYEFVAEEQSKTFEIAKNSIREDEDNNRIILVIKEVTQERRNLKRAQLQDRLATVGILAAGIAHDFNNILNIILGTTELIGLENFTQQHLIGRLDVINEQIKRGSNLVHQILDYGRKSSSHK